MSDIDSREGLSHPSPYTPHIEYLNPEDSISARPMPDTFIERFNQMVKPTYPQDDIQRMRQDEYNPFLIGYSHTSPQELPGVKHRLEMLLPENAGHVKVAHEIAPESLQWIKDFLAIEKEYKERGTIQGEKPEPGEDVRMSEYRKKQSHSGEIAIWLLEKGVEVSSIEHPDVRRWTKEDIGEEEESFHRSEDSMQPSRTARRRDVYGLEVLDRERPGIVIIGANHSLKYDMLLNRSGQRTYYFLNRPFDWENILQQWEAVH